MSSKITDSAKSSIRLEANDKEMLLSSSQRRVVSAFSSNSSIHNHGDSDNGIDDNSHYLNYDDKDNDNFDYDRNTIVRSGNQGIDNLTDRYDITPKHLSRNINVDLYKQQQRVKARQTDEDVRTCIIIGIMSFVMLFYVFLQDICSSSANP
jgi:hypothetical protein